MKLQNAPIMRADFSQFSASRAMAAIDQQVNALAEGRLAANYNAYTAPPTGTAGANAQGDYVKNSQPTEQGTPGQKYVLRGWICVADGTPGTWVEDRGLTGN